MDFLCLFSIETDGKLLHLSFFSLHNRFASLFQSSLKLDPGRDTVTLGLIFISPFYSLQLKRKTCFSCLFLSLHPRFASLFESNLKLDPCRDTVTLGLICISRVYSLQREIYTCFSCLFFDPTSSLQESILVYSKNGHWKRHSNA